MADYLLLAQYPKSQTVRDRNYSGLLAWAGYQLALAIPATKPEQAWVEQRLLAERLTTQALTYVDRTMGLLMMDPTLSAEANLRMHLSQFNSEATEATLSDQVSSALASIMPGFAASEIPQEEVDRWMTEHFPEPPV